jgi:hypothetical protein
MPEWSVNGYSLKKIPSCFNNCLLGPRVVTHNCLIARLSKSIGGQSGKDVGSSPPKREINYVTWSNMPKPRCCDMSKSKPRVALTMAIGLIGEDAWENIRCSRKGSFDSSNGNMGNAAAVDYISRWMTCWKSTTSHLSPKGERTGMIIANCSINIATIVKPHRIGLGELRCD